MISRNTRAVLLAGLIAGTFTATPARSFAQTDTTAGATAPVTTDDNDGFDWGWLGLLGLLGLLPRKRRDVEVHTTTDRTGYGTTGTTGTRR